eukprot:9493088-Pyramimonas_sp.AAC.1
MADIAPILGKLSQQGDPLRLETEDLGGGATTVPSLSGQGATGSAMTRIGKSSDIAPILGRRSLQPAKAQQRAEDLGGGSTEASPLSRQ